jgi:hypothetical protein
MPRRPAGRNDKCAEPRTAASDQSDESDQSDLSDGPSPHGFFFHQRPAGETGARSTISLEPYPSTPPAKSGASFALETAEAPGLAVGQTPYFCGNTLYPNELCAFSRPLRLI